MSVAPISLNLDTSLIQCVFVFQKQADPDAPVEGGFSSDSESDVDSDDDMDDGLTEEEAQQRQKEKKERVS